MFVKRKKVFFLIGIYLLFLLFVSQDAWLYDTTIAKITKVQTEKTGEKEGARGETEAYYRQTMQGILLNGKWKGSKVTLKNEYTYSGVTNQKYHRGDKVFIHASENGERLSRKNQRSEKGYLSGGSRRNVTFFAHPDYKEARNLYYKHDDF